MSHDITRYKVGSCDELDWYGSGSALFRLPAPAGLTFCVTDIEADREYWTEDWATLMDALMELKGKGYDQVLIVTFLCGNSGADIVYGVKTDELDAIWADIRDRHYNPEKHLWAEDPEEKEAELKQLNARFELMKKLTMEKKLASDPFSDATFMTFGNIDEIAKAPVGTFGDNNPEDIAQLWAQIEEV